MGIITITIARHYEIEVFKNYVTNGNRIVVEAAGQADEISVLAHCLELRCGEMVLSGGYGCERFAIVGKFADEG